ncbi:MAG: hypothetical protein H5U19_08705 [Rhodobacteraceae bacterium]|jgi:Flp pilus assembly pilin Flp|nr:hypothetical protein [Paracoccaceae bacterium]
MRRLTKVFLTREDGATTVDWVVLTAAIMSLVVIGLSGLFLGLHAAGENINSKVESVQPYAPAPKSP